MVARYTMVDRSRKADWPIDTLHGRHDVRDFETGNGGPAIKEDGRQGGS